MAREALQVALYKTGFVGDDMLEKEIADAADDRQL
jgi:hypothetical protein